MSVGFTMAPPIPDSKVSLSYPLYACDFDPQEPNRLIVGGGGGAGRSGVGNKITVLDTSHDPIQVSAEIELSRDEDNVTSLVAGQKKGKATLVYAGINSSAQEQQKGRNQHFRVFGIDQPSKAKSVIGPRISELSRTPLFTSSDGDAYQRLLRLSQPFPDKPQLGAVATGLAKDPQIVLFDVSPAGNAAPRSRGKLEISKEAADLDIIQKSDDKFQLAYVDDYDLYTMDVSKGSTAEPQSVYTIDDSFGVRPVFRSIRYLTPNFLLAVMNLPKRGGVLLQGFRLPTGAQVKARIAANNKLPKTVAQATALAVANLSPRASPSAKQGDTQFVVAVAGHDFSVSLYTLDHQAVGDVDFIANLFPTKTICAVHHGYITGLAFSPFVPPAKTTARLQALKLASVSIGNSAVVHSIPLKKLLDRSAPPARRAGPPRQPRYVVALKSHGPTPAALLAFVAVVVLLIAVLAQGTLEVSGLTRPRIGARHVVPARWQSPPLYAPGGRAPPQGKLAELLAEKKLEQGENVVVLVSPEGKGGGNGEQVGPLDEMPVISVETHDEDEHGPAKAWEELPPEQRLLWRERLKKGGHWVEGMGDTIFKGILFSEIGAAVGAMVGG